jgi:3-oxoacyl-[acyl-carrier protein] reductase
VLGISDTSRAGLIAWSKSLAPEVAKDGVTVNVPMPGRIGAGRGHVTKEAAAARERLGVRAVRERSWAQIRTAVTGHPGRSPLSPPALAATSRPM